MASSKNGSRKRATKQSPELQELLVLELQEIHSAETQLARLIPRISRAIETESVRAAVEQRLAQGEQILADVDSALEQLDATPGRKKNVAAEGLINDIREHIQEIEAGPALDTVLIAALQKTEHYCIAAWGTVKAQAKALGQQELQRAMERAVKEGAKLDEQLTSLAEGEVTPALMAEGTDEEDETGEDERPTSSRSRSGGRGEGRGNRTNA